MKNRATICVLAALGFLGACAQGDTPHPAGAAPGSSAAAYVPASIMGAPEPDELSEPVPAEKFTDGERAFRTVRDTLLSSYYSDGLTSDDLYRAAAEGMLARIEPKMHKWNKLMSPSELAQMESDLKGEVVGIGVKIRFDDASGYVDVLSVIAGSPAERAQLAQGDKIISVDGKLYKGKTAHDVEADIRGKTGETVTLTVLRADKLISVPVKREAVSFAVASSMSLPDGVGYLKVSSFNGKTVAAAKEALERISGARAHALVLDLRCNAGGLFDEAVATASLFLPPETPVVRVVKRGGAEEIVRAKGPRIVQDMPMAILVNGETSSGAEFVAAALVEGRQAQTVGTTTFGKWSAQMMNTLSNGYAMKYTFSVFTSPSGQAYPGVGMVPDVVTAMDKKALDAADLLTDPARRVAEDIQLRTAMGLLRHRP